MQVVARIKAGELDPYKALEQYVSHLAGRGLAPKTIGGYLTAARGLLRYEGVKLDNYEVRVRVGIPPNIESSIDRIPTRDELRILLLDSNHRTRALTVEVAVYTAEGKLRYKLSQRSESFLIAFMCNMEAHMKYGDSGTLCKDTSGVQRYVRAGNKYDNWAMYFGVGDSSGGIVAGTGTAVATPTDNILGAQISNGGGAGQLWYGSHSVALPIASAGKTIWNVSRSLQNGSGGTITINEVGIIVQSQDTSDQTRKFLIVRDKLSNGVDVLTTDLAIVTYSWTAVA
jgi:hypothetical protein